MTPEEECNFIFLCAVFICGCIYNKVSNLEFFVNMRIAREKAEREEDDKYEYISIKDKWACQSHRMYNMDCNSCVGRYEVYKPGFNTKRVLKHDGCIIL